MEDIAELDTNATSGLVESELPYALDLALTVDDRGTIAELCRYAEGESREQFALTALRIGVLALRQARGQLDGDVIRGEAERMLGTLQQHLSTHASDIKNLLGGTLREYFDPTSGRFNERVERLIRRDGDLETLLRAQVGNHDSEMCRTLAAHLGEQSPLMRKLSPEQKDGVLSVFQRVLETNLQTQSNLILRQFSLDNQEGALTRLVNELTGKHDQLGRSLKEKIDDVVGQMSLDDDNSFFSRLQRNLDATSSAIHKHLTLDDEGSSLARLQREVQKILSEHGRANQEFQEEVRTALAQIAVRKQEQDASTRHGISFQEAVGEFLQQQAQRRGDLLDVTANKKGLIPPNCKIGDFVWELGKDTAAPGARIAIEAKEEKGYSIVDAEKEIVQARKNRGADVGLFVFSRRTAPAHLETLARHGNDVFTAWDPEDPSTDVFLVGGVEVARALCLRAHVDSSAEEIDFGAIEAVIRDIEQRANSLKDVQIWAETIHGRSAKIIKHVRQLRNSITEQVKNLERRISKARSSLETGGAL